MTRPRSIWIAAALLLVWAACSSGPQKVGAQPSWRPKTTAAQPAIFEPQGEAVPKYNGPVSQVAATPLSDATAEAMTYLDKCLEGGLRPGMGKTIPDRLFWVQADDDEEDDDEVDGEDADAENDSQQRGGD